MTVMQRSRLGVCVTHLGREPPPLIIRLCSRLRDLRGAALLPMGWRKFLGGRGEGLRRASQRAFRASFILSKPRRVAPPMSHMIGMTKRPVISSPCTKRQRVSSMGSMMKVVLHVEEAGEENIAPPTEASALFDEDDTGSYRRAPGPRGLDEDLDALSFHYAAGGEWEEGVPISV